MARTSLMLVSSSSGTALARLLAYGASAPPALTHESIEVTILVKMSPPVPARSSGPASAASSGQSGSPVAVVGPLAATWLVFAKDVAIEVRTREIVTTAGFFAALVAILASISFYTGPEATVRVAPGAMWLAIA